MAETARAAEVAARRSYGRLLSWLAWQWRDIAAAEDALAEAFASALVHWPAGGVPQSPEAWLLTAARRQLLMAARRQRLADDPTLTVLWPSESTPADEPPAVPDQRLRLLFVCAHPAIDASVHAALMLQVVLGVEVRRMAGAFLVGPEALSKRLTRAKAKIRASRIRFEEPAADELPERLAGVLEAIYGAYTLEADAEPGGDRGAGELALEALDLAALVAEQMPDAPEARGLHALLLLCEARRPARRGPHGEFVPLDRQDPAAWRHELMARAEQELWAAAGFRQPGPYQIEAALQAAHMQGAIDGQVPWSGIVALYEQLLALSPSIGCRIGHALARARADSDPRVGLALLHGLDAVRVASHQPWWAARAHLLAQAGEHREAAQAYARAAALASDSAVRAWLLLRRAELPTSS